MPRTPKAQTIQPRELADGEMLAEGQLPESSPIVEATPIQLDIVIDISVLMLPDLRLISKIFRGAAGDEEAVDLLERVVVGGAAKVATIPATDLSKVLNALHAAVYGAGEPETSAGN